VDVLPTLLNTAGRAVPAWAEGRLLPGFGGVPDAQRATFSVDAKLVSSFGALTIASVAMRKGNWKLIYYRGYEERDAFELYDLASDPEELNDLYGNSPDADALKAELLAAFTRKSGPLAGG
jgi:arylsulfatase A-like enzyme